MTKIKKSYIFIPLLITVLLIVVGITVLVAGDPNEIMIHTGNEFVRFLEHGADQPGKTAILCADIRLDDPFDPVELACELDGNGHTLTVKDTGIPSLFSAVTETGAVRNLVLAGKEGSTDLPVTAGIALQNHGTIENCVIGADFSGNGFICGVCYTNNGTVLNCFVRSRDRADTVRRYVSHPICAENDGSVKGCYYSETMTGDYDTVGTHATEDEIGSGKVTEALNEYAEADPGLVGWKNDENGLPTLRSADSMQTASVFSSGNGVFLVCIVVMIVTVPIVTIVYADRQKKKIVYDKN